MKFPNNGKIVIIDDKPDEVKNLAKALTREKMPFLFYTDFDTEDLPDNDPVNNVRLLFLDLDLGLGGNSPIEKIRIVQGRLIKIIEPNTPYILVIWSSHEDQYAQTLKNEFENGFKDYRPIATCSLDKYEILKQQKEKNPNIVAIIQEKLKEQLEQCKSFNVFLLWESIVNDTCGEAVNEIISAVNNVDDWDKSLKTVLKKLAHAYLGNRINGADTALIQKSAMMTFNEIFKDNLENTILKSESKDTIDFKDVIKVNIEVVARLNSKLLFESNPQNDRSPGNVYNLGDDIKNKIKGLFKNTTPTSWIDSIINRGEYTQYLIRINEKKPAEEQQTLKEIKKGIVSTQIEAIADEALLVEVEMTPVCDFAQQKRIYTRHIIGCLFPVSTPLVDYIKRGADYLYISPLIDYNGTLYKLILDFRLFSSSEINLPGDSQPIFKIRHQLLSDIQINAAKHISRTGVTFIDERDH